MVILDGSTVGMSDEQYQDPDFPFEITLELVEIGPCTHQVLLTPAWDMGDRPSRQSAQDTQDMMDGTALLCLACVADDSGTLENRGTALVLNLSELSTDFMDHVIV